MIIVKCLCDQNYHGVFFPAGCSIQCTMSDFHNFGLIFAGQMHCLSQRLKSTFFEIFSNGAAPKGPAE